MNRKESFLLITLILSILCAACVAAFCYYATQRALRRNERALQAERATNFDQAVHGRPLIDQWKRTKTAEEQRQLWREWTQLKLDEEPWWFSAANKSDFPVFALLELLKEPGELERLRSEGWQTLDGGSLHLTPEQVWHFMHYKKIYELKKSVDSSWLKFWVASPVGAFVGFYGVWIIYAAARWAVRPALRRAALGFRK